MTQDSAREDVPEAASVRPRRLSWIWFIPLASLAIGGWLIWTTVTRRGPLVSITFNTAEGMQAGQSQLKYRDIQMGTVESFDLAPDRAKVVIRVRTTRVAEPLLTEGAQFWVVKPRLFAGDISGLNTLLSGPYLEMSPGDNGKPERRDFTGLENPPTLSSGSSGRLFQLTSARLGSLSVGSPVFFREVEVGKILDWALADMAETVTLRLFINAPYDKWVHDDTRFWTTSGIAVKLGAAGLQVQVSSLKAALLGGITFETPSGPGATPPSAEGHGFTLYNNEETAEISTAPRRYALATYLTGSIGGLAVGAPVMLMGLRVGEVTATELQFDTETSTPRVRVGFTLLADKIIVVGGKPAEQLPQGFRTLVANGLRTSLKGGNLLTGQKQLALDFNADAAPAEVNQEGDMLVIPSDGSGGGGLDDLAATANQLLAKIGKMPFADIGRNLNETLEGANGVVNGPALKDVLVRLSGTLAAAQDLVRHVDAGAAPAVRRLPAIASELQDTLAQAKALLGSVSAGSAGGSKFGRDLNLVLTQVADAATSVRMVADLLSRHPEALIRGRTGRAGE